MAFIKFGLKTSAQVLSKLLIFAIPIYGEGLVPVGHPMVKL